MRDLNKRILIDLFVTPSTIIPWALGGTLLMLTEVVGPVCGFLGFVSCLLGFGSLVTNYVFNLESISKRALKNWQEQQKKQRDRVLDELDKKLAKTPETNDEIALRNLRALYDTFYSDLQEGKIPNVPQSVFTQIDQLFDQCTAQLGRSFEMWEAAKKVRGPLQKKLNDQRLQIIHDVEESVNTLAGVISDVGALKVQNGRSQLKDLQRKLSTQLEIAKAVDKRMGQLDDSLDDNLDRYAAEYGHAANLNERK